jgi:amidase
MAEPDIDRYTAKWTDAVFMFPFNMSGQPAMSLPLHATADGIPVGVQLVAPPGREDLLIDLAAQLEASTGWR